MKIFGGLLASFWVGSNLLSLLISKIQIRIHGEFANFDYLTSISYLFSSFDLRRQSLDSHGKIWASETNSEMARAQLHIHSEPTAVLALHGVTQEDAGTYNCRVDFKKSPTRYRKIALDVIGKL